VEKDFPNERLMIATDKNKLIIALTNILINAVEAMEINEGKLSIALANSPDAYTLSIRDNGRGIPKDYLSKLFDPFFTLKKNGMGLGLTASYSIIQSHKTLMQVESTEGEGTHFLISFNKQ
jgi:C4-dicarboxylate-specific signal transduction histidine kinase